MLGNKVDLPFFVSPAAMARLAHPDGEMALARGAEKYGIAQCVCQSSFTLSVATIERCMRYSRCSMKIQELRADRCRSQQTLLTH
jgi:isopentenyl diphosphate isomerase/L-lactate dehydrogenase-like FMN-dependent dehydrogenase